MSEMIERVAKAIWDAGRECSEYVDFEDSKKLARAAIKAMREPTEEMTLKGNKHLNFHPSEKAAEIAYQAMIDAALKE